MGFEGERQQKTTCGRTMVRQMEDATLATSPKGANYASPGRLARGKMRPQSRKPQRGALNQGAWPCLNLTPRFWFTTKVAEPLMVEVVGVMVTAPVTSRACTGPAKSSGAARGRRPGPPADLRPRHPAGRLGASGGFRRRPGHRGNVSQHDTRALNAVPIELQDHKDELWFKNIYIKELPD